MTVRVTVEITVKPSLDNQPMPAVREIIIHTEITPDSASPDALEARIAEICADFVTQAFATPQRDPNSQPVPKICEPISMREEMDRM